MALTLSLPIRQVVLSRFGGLYTESNQRDLPMGASPLTSDCDFVIGSVVIRPGLVSIQSFGGAINVAGPTISQLSPLTGPVATVVTISGSNFGATQGASLVAFKGITATPTSWSSGKIVVTVPAGATTGNVTVTVGGLISNGATFTVTSGTSGGGGGGGGGGGTSGRTNLVVITGGVTVPGGTYNGQAGISLSLVNPYPSYLSVGDSVTVGGTSIYDANFFVAGLSPGPDPYGMTLAAGSNTQTAVVLNSGYVQFPASRSIPMSVQPSAPAIVQPAAATGSISPTATIKYIRSTEFTWVNSVGPLTMFQADDGTFWADYEVSGDADLIYSGFLNNARMLSETFGQYEFCGLGNWGNIERRIPLQGTDQPRTFTIPAGPTAFGPSASIVTASGSPQSATVNTSFSAPLAAKVVDSGGNPVQGVTVTFNAPTTGASATFGATGNGVMSVTAVTDSTGTATSATVFANATVGSYSILATAPNIATGTGFLLNNTAAGGGGGGGGGTTGVTINTLIPVRQQLVAISGQGGQIPSGPYAGQNAIAVDIGNVPVHPNLTVTDNVRIYGTGVYDGVHKVAIIQQPGTMSLVQGPGVGSTVVVQNRGYIQYEIVTVNTSPTHYNPAVNSLQNISGAPAGYNGNWTVRQNEVLPFQIVLLITGALNLANGSGGTITPATRSAPNVRSASPRAGSSVTAQFDRISQVAPASNNWTAAGSGTGATLANGQRWAVLLYQMRNGYITPASVPISFITTGDNVLTFTNLPTGPPEAQYVIVAVTSPPVPTPAPANAGIGGPYFWVPLSQAPYSTVVPNGTSTLTVTNITDVILTAGVNIAAPENNLLLGHQRELGEFVKVINYGARAFYLGERAKVDNLVNMTFDGGVIGTGTGVPGWTVTGSALSYSTIPSPIYGLSLDITNNGGSTVNAAGTITDYLSQNAGNDPFGAAILRPFTQYNARITAWADATAASTATVSMTVGTPSGSDPATPLLTTTPTEYTLTNININQSAGGANLCVVAQNVPAGGNVYIDRIEVYIAVAPVYSTSLNGSYIANYQAVEPSGYIDTSEFTYEPQSNAFRFLQSLYITTDTHTFSTVVDSTSDPSGWDIQELSNTVGCIGPAAADVGEEYVVVVDRRGAYLFDGGNHIKITEEIQSLWEQIYWPSISQIWVKNDLHKSRLYIAVPMVTPNQWLPNAPPMATPGLPNVLLMCNYLGSESGAEIAASPGVRASSFTGQLLAHDFTRKWSPWLIPAAYGAMVLKGAQSGVPGHEEVWFGGEGNATVWNLDATVQTDNGNVIQQVYTSYSFMDEMNADAKQLMMTRRLYSYMTLTTRGTGGLVLTTYPDSLDTPYANVLPAIQIQPAQRERNLPINEACGKLFLKFTPDGNPGSYFALHGIVLGVQPDNWIPITGSDEGEVIGTYGGAG